MDDSRARRDPSQWMHPADRMTSAEIDRERERLDEWRETAEPVGSWFLPQVE